MRRAPLRRRRRNGTCGTRSLILARMRLPRSISSSAISISTTSAACPSSSRRSSAPDRVVRTYCGNLGGESAREALERLFSPPLFPIRLDQLPAHFEHRGFRAGETLVLPGRDPGRHASPQPSGRRHRLPLLASRPPRLLHQRHRAYGALARSGSGGFRSRRRPRDLRRHVLGSRIRPLPGWGHSTWQKGVELCQAADVKALAIFHLYPGHDDVYLRGVEAEMQRVMPTRLRRPRAPDAELRAGGSGRCGYRARECR